MTDEEIAAVDAALRYLRLSISVTDARKQSALTIIADVFNRLVLMTKRGDK